MESKYNENSGLNIRDILIKYSRHYKLYLLIGSIIYFLSFLYIRYESVYYSVNGTLLIKTKDAGSLGKDDPLSQLMLYKGENELLSEIEILKSQTLAKRAVKKLNLQTRYYAIGNIKKFPIYPNNDLRLIILKNFDTTTSLNFNIKFIDSGHFALNDIPALYEFNKPFQTGKGIFIVAKKNMEFSNLKYLNYEITWDPVDNVAEQIRASINISPTKDQSKVLIIGMQTVHPEMAADIVNTLMAEYQQVSIEEKNQIATRTISFVNERLGIITKELGEIEQGLQDFKKRNQIYNINTQSELFLASTQDLEKQLAETEVNLQLVKYLEDYLRDKKNNFSTVPSSLGIEEPVLLSLVKQYNEIQLMREAQLKTITSENQAIKILEGQLEKLRLSLLENLRNLKTTGSQMKQTTESKIDGLNSSLSAIPLKEKELLEISRQQGIKQQLYLFLLQKREENAIALASTISNSQVVDPAKPNHVPISPDGKNIFFIALFLSLLLPTLGIYLKEILNNKVKGKHDITKVSEIPILGEITHSDEKSNDLFGLSNRGIVSEQFRSLRSNLSYFIGKIKNPVVMITSSFSGEGKSFCSVRLATVYAMAGKKTALLEFDIRKPQLTKNLGMSRTSGGISKYVADGVNIEKLPVPVSEVPNLYLISCGPIPPTPSEMLLDPRIDSIFEYLKKEFDVIIVDTAPFGLVSDAMELGKYADCTIYIIRYNYTLKKQLDILNEVYDQGKLPKSSVVLNDVSQSAGYGKYGYNYTYGTGYFNTASSHGDNLGGSVFSGLIKRFKSFF
jgi:tyrosine-protein kinase Etk/Wzc